MKKTLTVICLLLWMPTASFSFSLGINADNFDNQIGNPAFLAALKKMDADFILWHIAPEQEVFQQRLIQIVEFCRKNNFHYLFNTELVNYTPNIRLFKQKDGTYRWDLRHQTLEKLKHDPLFLGVVYDEPMLMQSLCCSRINLSVVEPYFAKTKEMNVTEAHDTVVSQIKTISDYYAGYGKRLIFEMVFPDYAHAAARGGALLAPKLLKENYNDLMYYVYAGAATQYKQQELWACIDLWFLDRFPFEGTFSEGFHTPQDLFNTLVFAYEKGFDYVYIEQAKGLMDKEFNLTEYGKKVIEFNQKRKDLKRSKWQDITPEYVITRFPDGYWGQKYSTFIPNHPYGSWKNKGQIDEASKNWLETLHRLSNSRIPKDANNWNATQHPYFSKQPYQPIAGLPPILVFDHLFEDQKKYPDAKMINIKAE